MTIPFLSFNWNRTRPNFFRRYKWAFKPEYEKFETEPVAHPDLVEFMRACLDVLKVCFPFKQHVYVFGLNHRVCSLCDIQEGSMSPREDIELAV